MTLVSEKTLPLKNAIKDILLKIKNNETAMAMSGVGLGVAGEALSFSLFRYVGFDSLAGETAFLASTAMSGVSAITALMGVYKLSSIAINKLSQALDPIANKIDNSVKNFKERLNGFWSADDLIENRKNMTREEKAYNSLFYQRELFDAENYSALRGFRDKIADEASKNKDDRYDIKNILEAVNKSPRVDIAPDAIDKLTAYREVFDKAINFLEKNCKEANQADLVRALKTFNENIKVSGSKENMEKALENLQKEHLENINSFEYSVRNSKTGSILMSDAAFILKRERSQSYFNSDFSLFLV